MTVPESVSFRLTLSGPGVSLEREIPQDAALAVLKIALGGTDAHTANGLIAGLKSETPRLSLREFLDAVGARTNPEKIAVFAAYLRAHGGQDDFSKEEVRGCFRSAGEPLPANFSRDFQSAIQSGWVAEDHGRPGRYYLTRKGEEATKRKSDSIY